eukprot:TRINITY_DN4902_c0_g1_i1.p1 TRINITY_DN4902_c0_g1~~TRINITY_DN4902_c0_g1_i1.p1  ORF type:complete len:127 (-),score=32.97 TRINITY_DN4902_c0_g1_i1:168-548(-)
MQQGSGADVSVTWEDQQNINTFGRLNSKMHEIDEEIKAKKEVAENLEDASNELVLADEDDVRFLCGEVFLLTSKEAVVEKLEARKDDTRREMEELEEEKNNILNKMAELKRILYGKFKDAINLEED